MERVKKKKNAVDRKLTDHTTVRLCVSTTNRLSLAVTVLCLKNCFDFSDEQMQEFLGAWQGLITECYSGWNTVNGLLKDCDEMAGIDIAATVRKAMGDW